MCEGQTFGKLNLDVRLLLTFTYSLMIAAFMTLRALVYSRTDPFDDNSRISLPRRGRPRLGASAEVPLQTKHSARIVARKLGRQGPLVSVAIILVTFLTERIPGGEGWGSIDGWVSL